MLWYLPILGTLSIKIKALALTTKVKGYFALFITSTVWGTTWVVSKVGVTQLPALQMTYLRQFIAGSIFLLYFIFIKKEALPNVKQFKWLFIMSSIMFLSANALSTWAVEYIPAGLGALIGALYPLCVVILERIFFNSIRINSLTLLGLFFGIVGIAIVFYDNAFNSNTTHFLLGISLSIFAMLSWSVGTIFIAKNKVGINAYYSVGWQMIISSTILFIIMQTTQQTVPLLQISVKAWWVIMYLVVFGSLFAFVAFIFSMKVLPTAIASLYAYINPIVAILCAYIFINEPLTRTIILGTLVTLFGVFLVNYAVKKNAKLSS